MTTQPESHVCGVRYSALSGAVTVLALKAAAGEWGRGKLTPQSPGFD